jgi:hypothetical protein
MGRRCRSKVATADDGMIVEDEAISLSQRPQRFREGNFDLSAADAHEVGPSP